MKKAASKVAEPAQIQPKSQFLFHKNLPPRDFSLMTLPAFITQPLFGQANKLIGPYKNQAVCIRATEEPSRNNKKKWPSACGRHNFSINIVSPTTDGWDVVALSLVHLWKKCLVLSLLVNSLYFFSRPTFVLVVGCWLMNFSINIVSPTTDGWDMVALSLVHLWKNVYY